MTEGMEEKRSLWASYKDLEPVASEYGGFEGYGAVYGNRDLGGDIIKPGAVKNIKALVAHGFIGLNHGWDDLPIGIIAEAKQDDKGLWIRTEYHSHERAQAARRVAMERLAAGKTVGLSIGYTVHPKGWRMVDDTTRELTAMDVHEVSQVNAPMNPKAGVSQAKSDDEFKRAIGPHTTPKADEGASWDAGAELRSANSEAGQLRRMHAWVDDSGDPDVKSSYKLPHHQASGPVVWRGVAAAMSALMGGRGGPDIPGSDRQGVYNHLAGHYRQFDKEPPELRYWSREELEQKADDAVFALSTFVSRLAGYSEARAKEGRELSSSNRDRLWALLEQLNGLRSDVEGLLREKPDREEAEGPDPRKLFAEYQKILALSNGVRL